MYRYIQIVGLPFVSSVTGIRIRYMQYKMQPHLALKLIFTEFWKSIGYECVPALECFFSFFLSSWRADAMVFFSSLVFLGSLKFMTYCAIIKAIPL